MRFTVVKSVSMNANGQRIATPTVEIIRLMLNGFVFLLCLLTMTTEKPDAANRIASALDATGKAKRMHENGVPYYMAKKSGDIVVVPALGHLYTVAAEKKGRAEYF